MKLGFLKNIKDTFLNAAKAVAIAVPLSLTTNINDAQAVPVDINFTQLDSQAQGSSIVTINSPYQESNFTLTNDTQNLFAVWQNQGAGYTGSTALFAAVDQSTIITQDNGNEFTVTSIDFAWDGFGSNPSDFTTQILGTNAAGDTLYQTCNVAISFSAATCQFDNDFTVVSLGLPQGDTPNKTYQFDNINLQVSSVPLPASAILFGSGLMGLAGIGASRKSKAPTLEI